MIDDGLYIGGKLYQPGTISQIFLTIDKRPLFIIGGLIVIYLLWRGRR